MNIKLLMKMAVVIGTTASCATIPKGATAIQDFDANQYLGTWYEIARLDHKFERNMESVIAQYSQKNEKEIQVKNSGFKTDKSRWKDVIGTAKFRGGNAKRGALKVSFFKPFYGSYNIVALDDNYKHALVYGKNYKYLWILSREKNLPASIKEKYLKKASETGYKTDNLIWVNHDKKNPNLTK